MKPYRSLTYLHFLLLYLQELQTNGALHSIGHELLIVLELITLVEELETSAFRLTSFATVVLCLPICEAIFEKDKPAFNPSWIVNRSSKVRCLYLF